MFKADRYLLLALFAVLSLIVLPACLARTCRTRPQQQPLESSSYQGVWSYPEMNGNIDTMLGLEKKAGFKDQQAPTEFVWGEAAALTPKWLSALKNHAVVLHIMELGVFVLAARDASMVGKMYMMGDSFIESQGHVRHEATLSPIDKLGQTVVIPDRFLDRIADDSQPIHLVEVTDPQELKELLRLARRYSPPK